MNLRKKLLVALGALLLGALAVFTLHTAQQFSREEKQITYPSLEALLNPYLAAEHFLKKQGIKLRRSMRLADAMRRPAHGHTLLFLAEQRSRMDEKQTESLLQWASEGGHLIVVAERIWDEDEGASGDLLLDRLGIEQYESKDLPPPKRDSKKAPPYAKLTKLYFKGESSPAYVSFDTRYHLHDEGDRAHVWAGSENATHILQLYYGDGLITVLSDPWIWHNDNIGKYDNAWLLWYLCQEEGDVTLLYALAPPHADSLWDALLRYFPEALAALALLTVLLLWHFGQRQGTLLPAAPRARRQLREHLRASGDFLQRRLGRAALIQRLQDDIERRAAVRHVGFAALSQEARLQLLAQLSRKSAPHVAQAMQAARKHAGAAEFIQQVARLQDLRNAL